MDKGDRVVEMACLGRPFGLGMLYDCRSDMLVPGMKLWDDKTLKSVLESKDQVGSDFEVIAEDDLEKKALNLNVNASLKLSFLGGLVKVSGSAKYLDDRKSSKQQSRVSLKYWSTSRFDQLTMDQLGHIQYPEVFSKKIATHVVVGVLFGADAFFVFDRKVEDIKKFRQLHGKMEVLIKALPGITKIKGDADLDMQDEDKKEASKLNCKFHGDVHLEKNPTTFSDAVDICKQLPKLLQGDNGPIVVPKNVWLYPLSKLNSDAARIVHEISTSLVHQAETVTEDLLDLEMQCNDLMSNSVCSYFSGIQTQLSSFKGAISEYKIYFSKKLMNILPTIREGGMEESQLANLFESKEESPFSSHHLSLWLKQMQRGVKTLETYLQTVKKIESIEFLPSAGDLDAIVNNLDYDHVVCFSIKVVSSDDEYLQQMRSYLRTQDSSIQTLAKSTPWFKNKELMTTMRQQVRQFTTFAEANKENEKAKFVMADYCDEDSDNGSEILLFENGMSEEFDPPGYPDTINISPDGVKDSSVHLEWSKPEYGYESVEYYTVCYGLVSDPQEVWKTKRTKSNETFATVDNLLAEKAYSFKVRAECRVGVSQYSKVSDPISTLPPQVDRLAVVLKSTSTLIPPDEEEPPTVPIYKLEGQYVDLPGKMLHKVIIGEASSHKSGQEKVLMVLGATGAGKTTLINGMVNYILGVEWKDDFRFKLITEKVKSQAHSQTSAITAYTINHMERSRVSYTLTIIDTPGFGDTSGLKQDEIILEQIKEFFSLRGQNGISHLDGIGFVTQSALARLTPTQQYIFDSILSIFGKDVSKNIFMMVTFADGQKPPVITAIEAAAIPHSGFFKFNNSALFAETAGGDDNFDEMFWRMGITSFKKFFAAFQSAESVSLTMTKDVLNVRGRLQAIIIGLNRQMQACLAKMEVLRQEKLIMQKHEAEISANRDFAYEIRVPYYETIKLDPGVYVTNCLKCNFTCHFPCKIPDNDNKRGCHAMTDGYCRLCDGNCHWTAHKNTGERFELAHKMEPRTHKDLKEKYESASSGKSALENMIASHQRQLEEAHSELHEMVDEARQCLVKLDEIALKPNPLTQVEYLQMLINSEKKQAKEGYLDRVDYLETTKEQAKLLSVMQDANDIDRRIAEEKTKKGTGWEENIETLEQIKRIKTAVEDIRKEREKKGIMSTVSSALEAGAVKFVGAVKSMWK